MRNMQRCLSYVFITVLVMLFVACAKNGYSLEDYKNANIAKDGVYEFNNSLIEKSNLLVKIKTVIDEKTGKEKKEFYMLNVDKNSKNYDFNENDSNIIKWPFYSIDERNRVSTRIYEKGTFEELQPKHSYFISGNSFKGEISFRYSLNFTEAKFIK